MAKVHFTHHLARHVDCPPCVVEGETVRVVLQAALADRHQLRGYILDDQNRLRKHMTIFVGSSVIQDRENLSDPVEPGSEIYVMQALSGG